MTRSAGYLRHAVLALSITLISAPAFAVNKDMVQLQTQIQQLQDAVARLQQSNDERMGVMKDLVQQNADQVNRMAATLDSLSRSIQTKNEGEGTKLDQVSGQIQSLNDSLDEIKARMAKLEKLTTDIQNQQQSMPQPSAPASSAPAVQQQPDQQAIPATPPTGGKRVKPSAGVPLSEAVPAPAASPASPPVDDLYKSALGDYMAAKYSLSAGEFADVIRYYPDAPLSGNSFYYLGEIDYRAAKYDEAVKDYDMVLQHFPDSNKVPAARLHKGQAYLAMKQNDAGVRELRALIQRFPNAPESMLARSKLSGMGITVTPRRPTAQ